MKFWSLLLLVLTGCAMPVPPVVDAKLNDLNRRVSFLYEMQRHRKITDERCAWYSGPEMVCATGEQGGCNCALRDDGFGIPEPQKAEDSTAPQSKKEEAE